MAYLLVPDKKQTRKVAIRKNVFFVGRARENDLTLPSHSLSRFHAQINRSGDSFTIIDRGSLNGVFINGTRIHGEAPLRDGDIIGFGEVHARFRLEEGKRVESTERTSGKIQRYPVSDLIDSRKYKPERREKYLELLLRFSKGLLQQSPANDVGEVVLDLVHEVWNPDRSCFITRTEAGDWQVGSERQTLPHSASETFQIEISRSVIRELENAKEALLISQRAADERFRASESLQRQHINSVMCAPLYNNQQIHGFLYADLLHPSRTFTYEDLEMFCILANLMGVKWENDQLWHQVLVQQQLEQELNLAAEIQRKFFPLDAPKISGYDVAAVSIPSRKVGGDSYYWHARSDGRLVFMIADVMGKGLPSALVMSQLQAIMRIYSEQFDTAQQIATAVNRFIFNYATQERFITLVIIVMDPESGYFTYTNAGHNPPIVLNENGGSELLETGGMPVGVFVDQLYLQGEGVLQKTGVIVLYTDGIVEARNNGDEEFGLQRLIEFSQSQRAQGSSDFVKKIVSEIRENWLATDQEDDWTVLIIKRHNSID